jgi:hypothetical protein
MLVNMEISEYCYLGILFSIRGEKECITEYFSKTTLGQQRLKPELSKPEKYYTSVVKLKL